jgi:hypothetical protein
LSSKKLKKNFEATLYSLAVSGLHYLCIGKSTSDMDNITRENRYGGLHHSSSAMLRSRVTIGAR